MMRYALSLFVLTLAGFASASELPNDESYTQDGLTVLHRSDASVYAVDAKQLQLTGAGVDLWMQTDFSAPQPTLNSAAAHTRNLARTHVDCMLHRYQFSQVRYYSEAGDLVASEDTLSPWVEPRDGSVGESLVRQICLSYAPLAQASK